MTSVQASPLVSDLKMKGTWTHQTMLVSKKRASSRPKRLAKQLFRLGDFVKGPLNETLGFELPHMTHQILDDGLITMNVFDAGGGALKGNRLIGSTTWDFEATYVLLPALCSGPRVT